MRATFFSIAFLLAGAFFSAAPRAQQNLPVEDFIARLLELRLGLSDSAGQRTRLEVLDLEIRNTQKLLMAIFYGSGIESPARIACLSATTGLVRKLALSPEDIEFLDYAISRMSLLPEEDTALRSALFGTEESASGGLPQAFSLAQNFPNPFNPSTAISYSLPPGSRGTVILRVHDIRGRAVRTLVEEEKSSGTYTVFWDGTDEKGRELPSGVYFCRMNAGNYSRTRKMVLLK